MSTQVQEEQVARTLPVQRASGLSHPEGVDPPDRLRLSVTDACNFACSFCHNEGSFQTQISSRNQLHPEDMAFYIRASVTAGVRAIKLTGGEPLIYQRDGMDIVALSELACETAGAEVSVSLTTNGQLLKRFAERLPDTGLSHVTVSVHTLNLETFRADISNSGSPRQQMAGIRAAAAAGMHVKANVVVMPDTVSEVNGLCAELFRAGAREVRLYPVLWSPFAEKAASELSLAGDDLLSLAFRASGLPMTKDRRDYVSAFLAADSPHLPRSVRLSGRVGPIVMDRIRKRNAGGSDDEGDYAVRISAQGALHARLFSPPVDLSVAASSGDLRLAVRAINFARSEISGLD
ncbi:radical SAM protein [Arthrobacter sp. NEB 688]|uniref:radical SAM protein n=1 Tax=Arthrobacter sp. NEB 688 TaxID=904039 RepID=UPI001564094B|nr:radical SAM protein [Arthrobacter sp. NEB 688]QKE82761.1 radical SAM protein [Arthrobacter sp. NEB 688]